MSPEQMARAQQQIADRAAVSDIETEAIPTTDDAGRRWYDTRPMLDPREVPDDWIEMSQQTIDYALQRGLVSPHPQHAHLLRITAGRAP